jgi:hypothetical protein
MGPVATSKFLVALGLRNLVRHWVKSGIVGAIMAFGTFLIVTGFAHLDSIQEAMERSITRALRRDVDEPPGHRLHAALRAAP